MEEGVKMTSIRHYTRNCYNQGLGFTVKKEKGTTGKYKTTLVKTSQHIDLIK